MTRGDVETRGAAPAAPATIDEPHTIRSIINKGCMLTMCCSALLIVAFCFGIRDTNEELATPEQAANQSWWIALVSLEAVALVVTVLYVIFYIYSLYRRYRHEETISMLPRRASSSLGSFFDE
jgi:hypothetical protein